MPPRSTRRSATPALGPQPLPKAPPVVRNGLDTGYGTEGRANLAGQMTTGVASETSAHFARASTRSQSVRQPSLLSQKAPPRESSSPRPDTALNLDAGYEASRQQQHQSTMPAAVVAVQKSATPVRAAVAVEEAEAAAPPGAFAVFLHTLPRYLPQVLQDAEQTAAQLCVSLVFLALFLLGVLAALFCVAAFAPLPSGLSLRRDILYDGLLSAVSGTGSVPGLETFGDFSASPEWEKFLAENSEKLDARLREIPEHPYPINRFEFESTLESNNKMQREDMRLQLDSFKEVIMSEARRVVEEGNSAALKRANDIFADSAELKVGMGRVSTHALTQVLYERHRLMTQVNFFSPGLGALVHPRYTSKTASPNRHKSWLTWWYMHQEVTTAPLHPPVVALMPWQEGTECWCAEHTAGTSTKAELTVELAHAIIPKTLYIEHVPAAGTLDISSAPKKFAVWAQVSSVAEASRIRALQEREWREDGYSWMLEPCGEAPKGEKDWICIRTGEYDIHFPHHVQDWTLYRRREATVKTKRISIRVTENWGAQDHTCLYRVRVTGDLADAEGLNFIDDPRE